MVFQFKLPDIGEGVHEGEIVEWHVAEGDAVKEDDKMVEVMTDKATVVITSPKTGTIRRILAANGAQVKVGEVIVEIAPAGEAGDGAKAEQKTSDESRKPGAPEEKTLFDLPSDLSASRRKKPAAPRAAAAPPAAEAARPQAPRTAGGGSEAARSAGGRAAGEPQGGSPVVIQHPAGRPLAAPAVRWKAREMGLDLEQVQGSGPLGRIRMEDLAQAEQAPRAGPTPATAPAVARSAEDQRVPVRGLRKAIFENMVRSEQFAVPFTYWDECDVTDLVKLREDARTLAERQGVKLTFLPFIVKAVVAAMRQHPTINAVMDEEKRELVVRGEYHIGIATATDRGLTVVVVKHADKKSVFQIAAEIEELSRKAREGKATREELTGSTFTITSLGKEGGLGATPVLNHPEVAILGVHKIEPRAVVDPATRSVLVRDRMNLSGTFDHRVIDGHIGAAFLQDVIRLLSQPNLLLLGTA